MLPEFGVISMLGLNVNLICHREKCMDYQLVRFKIDDINDFIRGSMLALPDFQRDFVWGPSKVVDLMQSIGREWPIGSILVLEGAAGFACKGLDNAPSIRQESVRYLLLDGQQRITSIYHATQDISDYVYYVDMSIPINGSLDENFIGYMRRSVFESEFPTIASRAKAQILKICELYESELFFEWLTLVDDATTRAATGKVRRNYMYGLNSGVYSVPATILPSGIRFEDLARIFESLNTNAVRLTTSDLLVAANLAKDVNLREMWLTYQSQDPNVDALDLELLDILKICAINEKRGGKQKIGGIKQTDLVKIDPHIYRDRWDDACAQLSDAITFCSNYLGLKSVKLLPNSYSLVALSFAIRAGLSRKELIEWWISRILGETFAQSGHTRMLSEVDRLFDRVAQGGLTFDYDKMQIELNAALSKGYSTNAHLARGILSLRVALSKKNDLDWEPYVVGSRIKIVGPGGNSPSGKDISIDNLDVVIKTRKSPDDYLTNRTGFEYRDLRIIVRNLAMVDAV